VSVNDLAHLKKDAMPETTEEFIIMSLPNDVRRRYDKVLVRQKDMLIDRIEAARQLILEGREVDWEPGFSAMGAVLGSLRLLAELWQESQYEYKTHEMVQLVCETISLTIYNHGDDRSVLWGLRATEVLKSANLYRDELSRKEIVR
jgi:hypothetical protein